MLLMEYDYATDIEVQREEAFEKGISQGEHLKAIETAKNLLAMKLSVENISKATGLSIEEVNLISNNTK